MKKLLLILLFAPMIGFGQTPQGLNYQAVARDSTGAVLINDTLTLQFSIISDSITGNISWQETHSVTTNEFGLFTTVIGQGTSTLVGFSTTFDEIDWGSGGHFLNIQIDGLDMGTTQFMSVPYALQAKNCHIPYEPYNANIMNYEWFLSDKWIFYVQFIAPTTGKYTHMTLFTTPSSTPTYNGKIGVAIYSNNVGNPGSPNQLLMSGTSQYINENMDKKFINIPFVTPIPLVANEHYWAAVAADHNSGEALYSGFHNGYNSAYDVVKYQTSGFSSSSEFPATTSSLMDGEYAYWFRIY